MKSTTRLSLLCWCLCLASTVFAQNLSPQPIPTFNVNESFFANEAVTISAFSEMKISSHEDTPDEFIELETDNNLIYKAGKKISVNPHTRIEAEGDGKVELIVEDGPIDAAWFAPEQFPGFVPKYHKLELGFGVPEFETRIQNFKNGLGNAINPFDPEDMDSYMIFTRPDGTTKRVNAFYFEPYEPQGDVWDLQNTDFPWRVRLAPDMEGIWSGVFYAEHDGWVRVSKNISFKCIPTDRTGYLTSQGRYLEFSDTGEEFFALGHNLYSSGFGQQTPLNWELYRNAFEDLSDVGGNFTRIEMGVQNALPDWLQQANNNDPAPEHDNYFLKMDQMWEYDRVVDLCDLREIYFIMFRHHVEISSDTHWDGISWADNPYNVAYGLGERLNFLTHEETQRWQNNCLRYIMARWGYTPKFAFYGHSEVDGWAYKLEVGHGLSDIEAQLTPQDHLNMLRRRNRVRQFHPWVQSKNSYIKDSLGLGRMMFLNTYIGRESFEKNEELFYFTDNVIGFHHYTNRKDINWSSRFDSHEELRDLDILNARKPVFMEETGPSFGSCQPGFDCNDDGDFSNDAVSFSEFSRVMCCTDIDFHNTLWASTMMGAMSTSMYWWWPSLHAGDNLNNYVALRTFLDEINLNFDDQDYKPRKWKEFNLNDTQNGVKLWKTRMENYYMVDENKDGAIGWIHNASRYWRNYENELNCMDQIINNNGVLDTPCALGNGQTELNYPLGVNWDDDQYRDEFTSTGGAINFGTDNLDGANRFELHGLRVSVPLAPRWYLIEYFSTVGNGGITELAEITKTNILGVLKPHTPLLNANNPDYAYRVTFLPNRSSDNPKDILAEVSQERGLTNVKLDLNPEEAEEQIQIYPTLAEDYVEVTSANPINMVEVYDLTGKLHKTLNPSGAQQLSVDVSDLVPGLYVFKITTTATQADIKVVKM